MFPLFVEAHRCVECALSAHKACSSPGSSLGLWSFILYLPLIHGSTLQTFLLLCIFIFNLYIYGPSGLKTNNTININFEKGNILGKTKFHLHMCEGEKKGISLLILF